MTERIHLSPPDVGPLEEAAVVRAMRSGWIAPLGPEVDAFEREMADYTSRTHAVALSSGTAALHLALLNWGVGLGDVVLTATMTFAATANAITYTGAEPVFVDCDSTGNIDVCLLEHALEDQRAQGRRVAAIVPVDLLGKVADYEAIAAIAARAGIPVLADAAESLGATRNGRAAGSFGDAAIISFNGNKVMTTSGGGMLLTDDEEIAARTRYLAAQARQPFVHYEHTEVGYNYRLSNLLAALGRAQLERLDSMVERRREIRTMYRAQLANVEGVQIFGEPNDAQDLAATRDNCWLTSITVDKSVTGWSPAELLAHLADANIEARPLWKPMHKQPVYANARAYTNGTSERLFTTGISLPSGSSHTDDTLQRVRERLGAFFSKAPSVVRR